MILAESAGYPEVARLAQSAYEALADGDQAPHWILSDMIGEASGGKPESHRKYSATAYDALSCRSALDGWQRRSRPPRPLEEDPLTSSTFRP